MKAKHQRLTLVALAMVAIVGAGFLALSGLKDQAAFFYAPSDLHGAPPLGRAVRLGGMVEGGSIKRAADGVSIHFVVTDGKATVPVVFAGITPDLFREKQAVVATGRMRGQVFVAEQVLAKHDETYVPKEVADKMGLAHQKHNVRAGAPSTDAPSTDAPPADMPSPQR